MSGLNSSTIRRINSGRVFHALRTHPDSSQRHLCALTQLDPSTVSAVINGLQKDGFVRRSGSRRKGSAGRPEELLQIAPDGGLLIGAAIGTEQIRLLACGLDGQPLAARRLKPPPGIAATLAALRRGIDTLLAELDVDYARVLGIGIGQHGPIDRDGYLAVAPQLRWRDVQLGALLRQALPAPVHVDNDTKAAALAESLFGACRDVSDFVFIHGSSGIGGALFLQGALYHGDGMAGELGHMKVVPDGRACGCGGRGCLEAYLSETALRERLAEAGVPITGLRDAARLAASRPAAAAVFRDAGHKLGIAMANLVNLLHPRRVVIAGNLVAIGTALMPAAQTAMAANALHGMDTRIEIILSELDEAAVELGGVALAMEAFLPSQASLIDHHVT